MGLLADRLQNKRPTADQVAASIESLRSAFERVQGVWRIYVFGSCVDGTYDVSSDIDIAVIFDSKSDYLLQRSKVLRARVETVLPWEPVLMVRDEFVKKKHTGGLAYEIEHRGKLIHDKGTEL